MSSDQYAQTTYSQLGEDLIVEFIFQGFLGLERPRNYIDIGANHPQKLNNTYRFYLQGSRGILVEPNPLLISEIIAVRPDDTCLNAAIAVDNEKSVDFFLMEPHQFSTIDFAAANNRQKSGQAKLTRQLKVPAFTVNQIIEKYCNGLIDLLSIDVEGIDFEILKTIDFQRYRPRVIILETWDVDENGKGWKRKDVIDFMVERQYFVMADTLLNTIFLSRA